VCDPIDEPEIYIQAAEENGLRLVYVIDTHIHADHISGARKLATRTGARYVLHASSGARFPFLAVHEGDVLSLGNVEIRVLHTPGHTPEHILLLVTDKTRSEEPWFALTGHTLMVGDMGRTELVSQPEVGAQALFESAQKILALPDYLEVLPGAFAGSVCGRALSGKPMSTIGFERRHNRALRIRDRDEFIRFMVRDVPPRPPQAQSIRGVNLGLELPEA
jgi:hydroxyacylglutathione hydrolase